MPPRRRPSASSPPGSCRPPSARPSRSRGTSWTPSPWRATSSTPSTGCGNWPTRVPRVRRLPVGNRILRHRPHRSVTLTSEASRAARAAPLHPAAVHDVALAGAGAAVIRGEEEDHARDVLRQQLPLQALTVEQFLLAL